MWRGPLVYGQATADRTLLMASNPRRARGATAHEHAPAPGRLVPRPGAVGFLLARVGPVRYDRGMTGHIARAEVVVDALPQAVWGALTDPQQVSAWMAGTTVTTDWQVGSPITWQGEMGGKAYEDKGQVLEVEAEHRLSMTHYSPLMG